MQQMRQQMAGRAGGPDGGLSRADKMNMENHQTGKSTLLEWSDYEFKTGLQERDFRSQSLKRIK